MKFHQLFLNSCAAVLVLSGTAVAQLSSSAYGEADTLALCSDSGNKATSKCSGSYTFLDGNQDITFKVTASANASFGAMTDESYSAVYNYGATTDGLAQSSATSIAGSNDRLYDGQVSVYRSHSGYTGFNIGEYG
jgi:hypothetical protein